MRTLLLTTFLSLTAGLAFAAPPPPPPGYISDAAQILMVQLTLDNIASYAALFADDAHVFLDGSEIAGGKVAWIALQKSQLGRVGRVTIGHSEGADNVFIVDQFDDRSALPTSRNLVFDARYVTRAEIYQFGRDHLIHRARIIQGGGMPWLPNS